MSQWATKGPSPKLKRRQNKRPASQNEFRQI